MLDLPKLFITEKGERHAKTGHPWVYEGEVVRMDGSPAGRMPEDGGLVNVFSPKARWLGAGYYNSRSKIRVRLISDNANDLFDAAFWQRRVRYALDYRKTVMGEDFPACRLIHGEADRFPGLTVDLFRDTLSVECLCLGKQPVLDGILAALTEALPEYGYIGWDLVLTPRGCRISSRSVLS